MKLLLEKRLLLRAAGAQHCLSVEGRALLESPANELFSRAVLRRGLLDNGYTEPMLGSEHAMTIACLPPLHKDPFDRLVVAQAMVEGITLLNSDALVAQYPGPARMV